MSTRNFDFALAIGGAAGQGIATPGNILARTFIRRGLHLYAYNAYQSIPTRTPMRAARASPSESGSMPTNAAASRLSEVCRILIIRSVPILPEPMMATLVGMIV